MALICLQNLCCYMWPSKMWLLMCWCLLKQSCLLLDDISGQVEHVLSEELFHNVVFWCVPSSKTPRSSFVCVFAAWRLSLKQSHYLSSNPLLWSSQKVCDRAGRLSCDSSTFLLNPKPKKLKVVCASMSLTCPNTFCNKVWSRQLFLMGEYNNLGRYSCNKEDVWSARNSFSGIRPDHNQIYLRLMLQCRQK